MVDPKLIAHIISLHREHRGLQKAVGDMTRKIKSEERWMARQRVHANGEPVAMDLTFPKPNDADKALVQQLRGRYYSGHDFLEHLRLDVLTQLINATKLLPVAQWVATQRGFGLASLAAIVGEAGDLSNYANPAKLWKRFSLHVIEGRAARRIKGTDAQEFVPGRRAEIYQIGDNFVRSGGPYEELYRQRKAYEIAKVTEAGLTILPAAQIGKRAACISQKQIHVRAKRYVEKRLLKNLWRAWRIAAGLMPGDPHPADEEAPAATGTMPPHELLPPEAEVIMPPEAEEGMSPEAKVIMPPEAEVGVSPNKIMPPEANEIMSPHVPVPRRGRPPGSKNKPKGNGHDTTYTTKRRPIVTW